MSSSVVFFALFILATLAFYYLMLVFRNKALSFSKKLIWSIFVLIIPIIGGVIYSIKKGKLNG